MQSFAYKFYLCCMQKATYFFVLILIINFSFAQENLLSSMFLIEGDSLPNYAIPLNEVVVFQPLKFQNKEDLNRYILLRRRVFRVYPYAKLAADRLTTLNMRLEEMDSKRGKKKYLKRLEKFVYDEFEGELRKLSRSQGRILIRLIHRQTGKTTFDLVKELRNGWRAFFYQTTASLFKLSLKDEFNPEEVLEDYLIEDILQRAFSEKYLIEQPSHKTYQLDTLYKKWRDKL